ncbi:hypothetical protein D9757_002684 [Collybiopsis confluens]|uniref:Orotidine 5'-phosphate decarboxylase n=1 Tax=Collybiopsis confluens TaxID=2823264 RepID=A0A8H5MEA1_9AGAR|nr:hypothetical protein D9757_002684 [Collybiopsis confluens]
MASFIRQTYGQRIQNHQNPAAKMLLETMERKKTNLAVSVDVTNSKDFLSIIEAVGPFTHVDIIEDFEPSLIQEIQKLSRKHDFLIFEDRKFADIGNTVALQYSSGVHKIASWSHITNAHPVPGPSIISGLSSVGLPLGRGLLLLAEMSTKGALAAGSYTEEAVHMARAHRDFVIGFIAQRTMQGIGIEQGCLDTDDFIVLTPGVGLDAKGDSMGQQYRTPRQVIVESGCDVIIVGRGIYGKDYSQLGEIRAQAKRYREAGWEAYEDRQTANDFLPTLLTLSHSSALVAFSCISTLDIPCPLYVIIKMRSAISIAFLCPIFAQCAPLVNNTSTFSSRQESAPQPEIIATPDGSETFFVAPKSSNDSSGSYSPQSVRPLLMGYFTCWSKITPSQIDFIKYDWIDFAFATVDANQQLYFPDSSCPGLLQQVVESAHAHGKHAKLSIGGWGGSQFFSSAVSTQSTRTTLANSMITTINNFGLDGIDIDWEYPGRLGMQGNQVSSADSNNYLLFLQLLRSNLPPNIKLSAAVSQTPFAGNDGQPMKDVSSFAQVLDWIVIMNYDVWQSSSSPGPNAPLSDNCHDSSQPEANAASAIKRWAAAGFPKSRQVLGSPFYGYLSDSSATTLRSRDASASTRAISDDGTRTGAIMFVSLVNQGILIPSTSNNGQVNFVGARGFSRYWDACSSTPFLRSPSTNQVISYDDPESLGLKARLAMSTGLRGINVWSVDGDYQVHWQLWVSSLELHQMFIGPNAPIPSLFLAPARCVVSTPFSPPSFPLAVRSPYLSAWLPQEQDSALNTVWPQFWNGQTLGWAGFLNVDGKAYSFLGDPNVASATFSKATQKNSSFTSTQSSFVLSAGSVDLTVHFLSPVEPSNFTKQSMPFSYFSFSAISNDGGSHTVQVYSDISAEWVSGNTSQIANWTTSVQDVLTHQIQLQNPSPFSEVNDRAQSGSAYYSTMNQGSALTYQTGEDVVVRSQFINNSKLANSSDTEFRAVSDRWPVFAFAHDLGTVSSSATDPIIMSIGFARDPAVQYIIADGQLQSRSLYFMDAFNSPSDVITSFIQDYSDALDRANNLDAQVNKDASAVSSDYAGLVALSIRQLLGATEITISQNVDGSYNTNDVLVFFKEISSDGNVNTVDVIYPAWPGFLYLNPELGKLLLEGLFAYQATGQYPNKYSAHDLGASYPKAVGHNDGKDEAMPVEESGNMVIMALSYALKSGDTSQLSKYESLLDQWTQFLIEDSLIPNNQLSTDDFAGTLVNQTNLAIKGISGIKAMSKIAELTGDSSKSSNYSSIASSYVSQWQTLATSSTGDHLTLNYGNTSSWGLSYNLYADKLLQLNLFPDDIYTMQTNWYKTVQGAFGVPLDTRHTYTKSDWQIFTSAIMTDTAVRDMFISSVTKFASGGTSSQPLTDWYDTVSGAPQSFRARPVVGGHLALLALDNASISNGSSTSSSSSSSSSSPTSSSPTSSTDPSKKDSAAARSIMSPLLIASILPLLWFNS